MKQSDIVIVNNHRVMEILEKFSLAEAGEVAISLYDKDGKEVEHKFKNIKQMIKEINANNIKCVDGVVTDQEGNPVTVANSKN